MDIRLIIIILPILLNNVLSKKYASSSEESIENLLYYKDCQKKATTPTPQVLYQRVQEPPKPRAMDCPYPKMCCSLTCGEKECGTPNFYDDHIEKMDQRSTLLQQNLGQSMNSNTQTIKKSQNQKKLRGKGKKNQPMALQPITGRRGYGFTKDRIKSLINQDDDIRKILKDLVRVTMQKVDLVDMIHSKKVGQNEFLRPKATEEEGDSDDDLDN